MNTNKSFRKLLIGASAMAATFCLAAYTARASAVISIINSNAPGVGFNDPTPAAPVGGNPGTTLGQQRLNAFQYAANIWGSTLDSAVEIRVQATFEPLSCTASSATLGSAGTWDIESDFAGAILTNIWYPVALANKLGGVDLTPGEPHIIARFNSNLGATNCLFGTTWYLGFDRNHGTDIDLVTVLLHEFSHGLGFAQFASTSTGEQIYNMSDVYGRNLLDLTLNKTWDQMTDTQRVASAINSRKLVWAGKEVTAASACVLSQGTPVLRINSPSGIAGYYAVGSASFGPPLSSPGITAALALASPVDGCGAITNNIAGKIAVINRGTCTFAVKAKAAQNAGAVGVIIADNAPGSPPAGMSGSDPSIVIPTVRVTQADGNAIKAALAVGSVTGTLGVDLSLRAGADAQGRLIMNTPNPLVPGSSVSHWDPIAFPNQLMEPAINDDLTHNVKEPFDLTVALFRDIGWFKGFGHSKYDLNNNGCVDKTDYNILMNAIRLRSTDQKYDLNCDGKVDAADARTLMLHFTLPNGVPCP